MKQLTEDQIKEINLKCSHGQGVFVQPYGIPDKIKEPVIYRRYNTGGENGGSCWGAEPKAYTADPPEPWIAIDHVLEVIKPDCTFLQFRKIEQAVNRLSDSNWEYYGNYDNFNIEYIEMSKVYEILGI